MRRSSRERAWRQGRERTHLSRPAKSSGHCSEIVRCTAGPLSGAEGLLLILPAIFARTPGIEKGQAKPSGCRHKFLAHCKEFEWNRVVEIVVLSNEGVFRFLAPVHEVPVIKPFDNLSFLVRDFFHCRKSPQVFWQPFCRRVLGVVGEDLCRCSHLDKG